MKVSELRDIIKTSLDDDGVYRTNTFIENRIDEGQKLVALFSLFDERRVTLNIDGTRNFNALPTDSDDAECIAPLHVANTHSGVRIQPTNLVEHEFQQSDWEGVVDTQDALYYTLLSPFHSAWSVMVLNPIQNIGRTQLSITGAFIPADTTSSTELRIIEGYQDVLFHYVRFVVFVSEPARSAEALESYKAYIARLGDLVRIIKLRFPSGRDLEPYAPEFTYEDARQTDFAPPEKKEEE